jgi:hypothetical protein
MTRNIVKHRINIWQRTAALDQRPADRDVTVCSPVDLDSRAVRYIGNLPAAPELTIIAACAENAQSGATNRHLDVGANCGVDFFLRPSIDLAGVSIVTMVEIDGAQIAAGEHIADPVSGAGFEHGYRFDVAAPRRRIVRLGRKYGITCLQWRLVPTPLVWAPCPSPADPSLLLC